MTRRDRFCVWLMRLGLRFVSDREAYRFYRVLCRAYAERPDLARGD